MKKICILHIEDSPIDATLVARELKKANIAFEQEVVSSKDDFLYYLDTKTPDIILSDHSLPAFNSLEALKIVKQKGLYVPFILITGNSSEEFAVSVMKEGADDYILKDRMQRLPSAILNVIDRYEFQVTKARAEKEQKDSENFAIEEINKLAKRLQLATKSAGIGVWEYDILNNHVTWDERIYELYNVSKEQMGSLYEAWLSKVHPNDKERIHEELRWAIIGEKEYDAEFRIVWEDGSIHHLKANGFVERNKAGIAFRMIGVNWDITAQKKEEEHLKLLESVITHTNDAVLITEAEPFDSPSPKILYVNEAFTKMTGYTAEEVIGQTPRILQGPKSDRQELDKLKIALKKWESFEVTTINYKKNGDEFWINFSISPVANENGWFTHWIAIERDVTESKLAEIRLKELNERLEHKAMQLAEFNTQLQEQNQKFRDIGWTQSHIVRAPLARMMGISRLIKELKVADPECAELLNYFNTSADELDEIIKQIVEKAREAIFD